MAVPWSDRGRLQTLVKRSVYRNLLSLGKVVSTRLPRSVRLLPIQSGHSLIEQYQANHAEVTFAHLRNSLAMRTCPRSSQPMKLDSAYDPLQTFVSGPLNYAQVRHS